MTFTGISWYVAPDGSPRGDGSAQRPWDLVTALGHPPSVQAGDVIWLRGGVYAVQAPLECRLKGAPDQPVQVWGDPDDHERAVLELSDARPHALHITGAHAWYGDFVLRCTSTLRWSDVSGSEGNPRGTGILCESGLGIRLIRLTIHDFGTTLFESQPSGIAITDCILSNAYWDAPDRSHGPGLYVRNPRGAPRKRIAGNVIFQHGRQGLQGFGSTPFAEVDVMHNVFFNNGIGRDGYHRNFMFGSASDEHWNVTIEGNTAYFPSGGSLGHEANQAGGDGGSHRLALRDNWIAHEGRPALRVLGAEEVTIEGNRIVGGVEYTSKDGSIRATTEEFRELFPHNTYFDGATRPAGAWVRVRRDESLPDGWRRTGRAVVTVINWDHALEVEVDLSPLEAGGGLERGTPISVGSVQQEDRRIQIPYGGGRVSIPMTGWSATRPVGREATASLPPTFPELGVFIVQWQTAGAATRKEQQRLADPGAGLPARDAKAARRQKWAVADPGCRTQLRLQRRAQWRTQTLERPL